VVVATDLELEIKELTAYLEYRRLAKQAAVTVVCWAAFTNSR
jgi:hypothetical protein